MTRLKNLKNLTLRVIENISSQKKRFKVLFYDTYQMIVNDYYLNQMMNWFFFETIFTRIKVKYLYYLK